LSDDDADTHLIQTCLLSREPARFFADDATLEDVARKGDSMGRLSRPTVTRQAHGQT